MRRQRRAREGQKKRKRENKQPILKMLCAALLRSFRGQHSEKMKGSARGNWDPREGQQPFRPNPNGAVDCTTTLRRLLIGAEDTSHLNSASDYGLCAARSLQLFVSLQPWVLVVGSCLASVLYGLAPCSHSSEGVG